MALVDIGTGTKFRNNTYSVDDLVNLYAAQSGMDPATVDRNAVIEAFTNPWQTTELKSGNGLRGGNVFKEYGGDYDAVESLYNPTQGIGYQYNPIFKQMFVDKYGWSPFVDPVKDENASTAGATTWLRDKEGRGVIKGFIPQHDDQGNVTGFRLDAANLEGGFGDEMLENIIDAAFVAGIPAAASMFAPAAGAAGSMAGAAPVTGGVGGDLAAIGAEIAAGGGGIGMTGPSAASIAAGTAGNWGGAADWAGINQDIVTGAGGAAAANGVKDAVGGVANTVKDAVTGGGGGGGYPFPVGSTVGGIAGLAALGLLGDQARDAMTEAFQQGRTDVTDWTERSLGYLDPYLQTDPANDPYLQAAMADMRKGVESSAAARGMLGSGRTLQEISDTTFARGYLPWRGQNLGAAQSAAGISGGAGTTLAQLGLGEGQANADFYGQMGQNMATLFQGIGQGYDQTQVMNSPWFQNMLQNFDISKLLK